MMKRIARKLREERGFTLIELMVVVLIIGILIAIALPTFLGARARAQNKAATSDLRNAIAAAKTCYTDNDAYVWAAGQCDFTTLGGIEPSLRFVDHNVNSSNANSYAVSVAAGNVLAGDGQAWGAARLSAAGNCYMITDLGVDPDGGGPQTAGTFRTSGAPCNGDTAIAKRANDGSW